jgi:hypothetical protein
MQVVKIALGVALMSLSVSEAQACADVVSFDRTARLSIDDVGRIGPKAYRYAGEDQNGLLQFDSFRADARPVRSGKTALAVVGARGVGIDEPAVVGVLWTTKPELFAADALAIAPTKEGGAAVELTAAGACGKVWRLELTPKGVVSINGRKIGEIAP